MVMVAVDGIIMAAGMVLFLAAILGVSAALAGGFDQMLLRLGLGVPGFGYAHDGAAESGNALFGVYSQLRWACLPLLGAAAAVSALRDRRHAGRVISRAVLAGALLFAFPPAWDHLAWAAGAAGMLVLNPLYTLDPDQPCPAGWGADRLREAHASSPYGSGDDPAQVCSPGLRISYLVGQAAGITDAGVLEDPGEQGPLGLVAGSIPAGLEGIFVNVFAAVFKAVSMINLVVVAAAAGVVLDLFTGLVIGSLPVMVLLGAVPGLGAIPGRLLGAIPALLLAPVSTALVVVAGSSAVAASDSGTLAAWVGAVSVLLLAALMPAMMVPAVSSVVHAASGALSSAVYSAAAATGLSAMTVSGASRGGPYRAVYSGLEGLAGRHTRSLGGAGGG